MFCLQCGKEISDNSTVCQFCGAVQPQSQQAPQPAPQPAPQQAPYGAPQQAPYGAPQQAPYGVPQQAPYGAPQQQFPPIVPPTPPKKKSKAPMIIGIVVGIIVLLAIVIGIAGSGDSSSPSTDAPVEDFGDYDFDADLDDSVKAADVHTVTLTTAEGLTNTITYYCDGDEVKSWTQVSTASVLGVDEALIEQSVAEVEARFAPHDFIDYSYTIEDYIVTETFVINDVSDNIDALIELELVDAGLFGATKISWEQTKANMLAQGYTEVE